MTTPTSRRQFIRYALLGSAAASLLAACGPGAPATAPAAAAKPAVTDAHIAIQVKPTGFYTLKFIAQQISFLFLDKLLTVADDWTLQPRLAERWETAPDGKSVTFFLRKGLKWSDGAPLTAKD